MRLNPHLGKKKRKGGLLFPRGEKCCLKADAHKKSVPMEGRLPWKRKTGPSLACGALMVPRGSDLVEQAGNKSGGAGAAVYSWQLGVLCSPLGCSHLHLAV